MDWGGVVNGAGTTYVLDTNVFVEAYQRYYALDLCPGFWTSLEYHVGDGRVHSIDRVKAEIAPGDDLRVWVDQTPEGMFASTAAADVVARFADIMAWVQAGDFMEAAKAEFATIADGWLVAYAAINAHTVVTHEVIHPDARRRVPIPNICAKFGVQYANTFDMLRDCGIQFDWGP